MRLSKAFVPTLKEVPADATIAALAASNGIPLFTQDEHFGIIAGHSGLMLYS